VVRLLPELCHQPLDRTSLDEKTKFDPACIAGILKIKKKPVTHCDKIMSKLN
jgi:hypothetical protein